MKYACFVVEHRIMLAIISARNGSAAIILVFLVLMFIWCLIFCNWFYFILLIEIFICILFIYQPFKISSVFFFPLPLMSCISYFNQWLTEISILHHHVMYLRYHLLPHSCTCMISAFHAPIDHIKEDNDSIYEKASYLSYLVLLINSLSNLFSHYVAGGLVWECYILLKQQKIWCANMTMILLASVVGPPCTCMDLRRLVIEPSTRVHDNLDSLGAANFKS